MPTVKANPATVAIEFNYVDACELADDIERAANVLDDEGCQDLDQERSRRLLVLVALIRHNASHLIQATPARVPSDRPTVVDPYPGVHLPSVSNEEPEPSGREAATDLPKYIDVLAAHIPVAQREFTVRIFHCDFTGRRSPNEALARTFPTEDKARQFYVSTQNIQNMKIRAKEAVAIDVVLGVQDKRSHAKKKSYREWEHTLCKGGPG